MNPGSFYYVVLEEGAMELHVTLNPGERPESDIAIRRTATLWTATVLAANPVAAVAIAGALWDKIIDDAEHKGPPPNDVDTDEVGTAAEGTPD